MNHGRSDAGMGLPGPPVNAAPARRDDPSFRHNRAGATNLT
jgi:hypothetical protein